LPSVLFLSGMIFLCFFLGLSISTVYYFFIDFSI
jgi:hypothetical protein